MTMPASDPREERIVALELLVTHLESDLGALNSALLEQQKQIDALKRAINRLESRFRQLSDEAEPRDLGDERPPHY
jgi:SlyX protein